MISILVPSYGRADRITERVKNIHDNTDLPHEVIVIVEPSQLQEYAHALQEDAFLINNERTKNYAGAVNTAVQYADERTDYVFLGSDDLNFHREWDYLATSVMKALPNIKVVGTNDLWNGYVLKGLHATHYLIDKSYIDDVGGVVDGDKGHVLFEGYDHNFTDTEFIGTAKARAVFAPCLDSVVEHLHWTAGKSQQDATSSKAYLNLQSDSDLYHSRRHLWWDLSR